MATTMATKATKATKAKATTTTAPATAKGGRVTNPQVVEIKTFFGREIAAQKHTDEEILQLAKAKFGKVLALCKMGMRAHRNMVNKGMRAKWGIPAPKVAYTAVQPKA